MDPGSEASRLGLVEITDRLCGSICGDYFVSEKLTDCPKDKAIARFQSCGLKLKLFYINICSYPSMFCTIYGRQASMFQID